MADLLADGDDVADARTGRCGKQLGAPACIGDSVLARLILKSVGRIAPPDAQQLEQSLRTWFDLP